MQRAHEISVVYNSLSSIVNRSLNTKTIIVVAVKSNDLVVIIVIIVTLAGGTILIFNSRSRSKNFLCN